ncbi:MAG: CDP-alcohol phosphatidyltransferase family protein [Deltaproteobacteria bacterium]|nr:CDP-alcohol phosphatidyltransferase family protein [Deltaproteobacteria bacterium]
MDARVDASSGRWLTVANGLTAVRLALAPACASALVAGLVGQAFIFFWLAVATDLTDGLVARRRGEESALGALLDHSTDALFVSFGLAALAMRGEVPALLPLLVVLAFIQYALDSRALAGYPLRTSMVGRHNGIAYYVLLGTPVVRDTLSLGWPSATWVEAIGWLLVATTLISMADRAIAWVVNRRALDSRGGGR